MMSVGSVVGRGNCHNVYIFQKGVEVSCNECLLPIFSECSNCCFSVAGITSYGNSQFQTKQIDKSLF